MECYTFIYTRTAQNQGRGGKQRLVAQEKACRTYAKEHGLTVHEVIRERKGGYRCRRPHQEAMLQKAAQLRSQGIEVRIVCLSPDRLTRDGDDWGRLDHLRVAGIELHFVKGTNAEGQAGLRLHWVPTLTEGPTGQAERPFPPSGPRDPVC